MLGIAKLWRALAIPTDKRGIMYIMFKFIYCFVDSIQVDSCEAFDFSVSHAHESHLGDLFAEQLLIIVRRLLKVSIQDLLVLTLIVDRHGAQGHGEGDFLL
jgi:hypothetical protein